MVGCAFAQDPTVSCIEELKTNTELQGLYKKMPLDVSKGQSLEILSNNTKPTVVEKKLILKFMESVEACSNQGSEWRTKNYPLVINNLGAKFQSDIKIGIADLYSGKLTFGELAKIRTKMMTDFIANLQLEVAKMAEAINDRNAQIAAEREAIAAQNAAMAEEARRQAVLQYYMRSLPTYQPLPMPRAPVTTNCNAFGNQLNCVTR